MTANCVNKPILISSAATMPALSKAGKQVTGPNKPVLDRSVSDGPEPNVTLAWADLVRIMKEFSSEKSQSAQEQSGRETEAAAGSSMAEKAHSKVKRASELSYLAIREV